MILSSAKLSQIALKTTPLAFFIKNKNEENNKSKVFYFVFILIQKQMLCKRFQNETTHPK